MIKKILQTKNQNPITLTKHASFKPRLSQKSQISSTNSFTVASFHNIDQTKSIKNTKNDQRPSLLNISKVKSKFEEVKENQKNQIDILQQKMQNVSCLYSNFIYKNSQKNFIDDMKLQRYRIMVQNQRVQKNQLMKDIQNLKVDLRQSQRQKQTVMFAYRALQTKIRQKQRLIRMKVKNNGRKQKLSINVSNTNELQGSTTSMFMEADLMISRQLLTSQGILSLNEDKQSQNLNKFLSSKSISKYLDKPDGIKQWQEKQKLYQQMENQLNEIKPKLQTLQYKCKQVQEQNGQLSDQVNFYKEEYNKAMSKISDYEKYIDKLKQDISSLHSQNSSIQSKYNEISLKHRDQELQAERKKKVIQQLQNTKYTYLMKEQKQKQQMQLLKQFTQNLQLNDQKINEFIQTTFGNQLQNQIKSQNKLYKQDISYILHLIKKKQNIYSELIKQYQQKHRQTQTRCFLLQKKLHLTDIFVKKLDSFIQSQIQLCQVIKLNQNTNKKYQNNKSSEFTTINKFIQTLKSLVDNYHLDKRII